MKYSKYVARVFCCCNFLLHWYLSLSLFLSHSSQLSESSLSPRWELEVGSGEKRSNLCASYLKPAFNGPQGLAKGLSTAEQSTALLAKLKNFCVAVTPPPPLHGSLRPAECHLFTAMPAGERVACCTSSCSCEFYISVKKLKAFFSYCLLFNSLSLPLTLSPLDFKLNLNQFKILLHTFLAQFGIAFDACVFYLLQHY